MNLKKLINELIYRIFRKFSKLTEKTIHAEALVRDDMWERLKSLIGKGYIWFVITPANYDYCSSYFNIKLNKKQFSEVLSDRIKYLKNKGEEVQLHIHLCNVPAFFDKKLQEEKFEKAMNFMHSLGIKPTKFAPGWRQYNDFTINLAKKYGITVIYDFTENPLKKSTIKNGIIINYYWKFWHDYDLI
jgi:hypothetical protein